MALTEIVQFVAAALLGGGLVGGIAQILNSRNEARRIHLEEEENEDFRRPMVAVEAAERSVAMMVIALDKADRDIKRLEETITRLQSNLEMVTNKYEVVKQDMLALQAQYGRGGSNGIN